MFLFDVSEQGRITKVVFSTRTDKQTFPILADFTILHVSPPENKYICIKKGGKSLILFIHMKPAQILNTSFYYF